MASHTSVVQRRTFMATTICRLHRNYSIDRLERIGNPVFRNSTVTVHPILGSVPLPTGVNPPSDLTWPPVDQVFHRTPQNGTQENVLREKYTPSKISGGGHRAMGCQKRLYPYSGADGDRGVPRWRRSPKRIRHAQLIAARGARQPCCEVSLPHRKLARAQAWLEAITGCPRLFYCWAHTFLSCAASGRVCRLMGEKVYSVSCLAMLRMYAEGRRERTRLPGKVAMITSGANGMGTTKASMFA
jgi:hypothetical protein